MEKNSWLLRFIVAFNILHNEALFCYSQPTMHMLDPHSTISNVIHMEQITNSSRPTKIVKLILINNVSKF